ncbi:hypothetical protein N8H22_06045 [Stutzerimonas stutzeri]|uniref:hypothetical protein n=1 Tax=Stutzerimonas sp. S1 TaxID=3030652 RepID=UPI0022246DE0|nr:hypothetical protein [Stutzerimonas sp. S1]MCW3148168.1 hypothetical protein [Stutzerimonas sp. S1]
MSIIANLQLNQWQEHQLPDRCDGASQYLHVNDDFVISRTTQGVIVSIYGDDEWSMKMYDAQGTCVYNFVSWAVGSTKPLVTVITGEMKKIQLARMYLFHRPRKPTSIRLIELRRLSRLALNNDLSLSDLLDDANINRVLLPSFAELAANQMKFMLQLLKELFDLRVKYPDFKFAPTDYAIIERIQALYDKHPKQKANDSQQTKLIPSRLYAAIIAALNAELDDFNTNADAVVELFRQRKANPRFGLPECHACSYKDSVAWEGAIAQYGLSSRFESRSIANWLDLLAYLGEAQSAAKYWIHLFTGMRANEARHLPADAYTTIKAGGADVHILRGYTSKIAGQNQTETFWMTAEIIEKGVVAARHIGKIAALISDYDDSNLSHYPLFPSLGPGKRAEINSFAGAPVISQGGHTESQKRLLARWPDLIVEEADIRELEQFDGFRDWRNDPDVKVGQVWPLLTHQCRRSLAVYCARSGLVSVGSLGLQFKHLSEVMTSYYRKGSAFAVNFLNTDDAQNMIDEIEYERHKAQYINYEVNVISTTSRLWGGEGNRIQVARDKGQPLIITTDREMTKKKFLKGEITYKLGPIGGCTNLEPCDKISFTSVFACIDCEKSILDDDRSLKNIQRGLNNLKRGQSLFAPENPQYKQLESEISEIYDKLEKRGMREKMEAMA